MRYKRARSTMLTASDVADLLNINISTVRRWTNKGIMIAYRIGTRGDRRFRQEDIDSFLSEKSKVAKVRRKRPLRQINR